MAAPAIQLDEFRLQDAYYRLLRDEPETERCISEMIEWEDDHPRVYPTHGWEWQDVHTQPGTINRLIAVGLVDKLYKSRAGGMYRLHSLDAARAACDNLNTPPTPLPAVNVGELFSLVVGHERVKAGLKYAIKADGPVHAILTGPPGTAKTLMLGEIGRLPGAVFYVGSTTSKAGLVDMLISDQPRYLVIDELDKMATIDTAPLLNLMQNGFVSRLIHGSKVQVQLETAVFAGANDVSKIRPELLSRFAKFDVPAYTPREFVGVASAVLSTLHHVNPDVARLIAASVVSYSTDIRDAIRVAQMARGNPITVPDIVTCLFGSREHRPALR